MNGPTDDEIQRLADEAEAGYELTKFKPKNRAAANITTIRAELAQLRQHIESCSLCFECEARNAIQALEAVLDLTEGWEGEKWTEQLMLPAVAAWQVQNIIHAHL